MSEKDFSLSVGVRGTLLGYDAAAAFNRQHGVNCFQGQVSINGSANGLISLLDEDLSEKLRAVLPEFLSRVNADVSFSFGYNHSLFSVDTDTLKFTAISLKNERGEATGSGFLCEVSDGKSSGIVAEIIKTAKDFIGIDNLYLYISNGQQPVDIGRLLNPFDKKDTISPPAKLFNSGFCLYSRYDFSESRGGVLDRFLGELLGVKSLEFFAGKDAKNKVRKLYGEIDVLNGKINDCRNRLSRMSWWEKIFGAPIIGCEISGLEIAKGAIYAAIAVAEAALTVAQAAVKFAGTLGEGVLKLVNGVIDSVTSLFFIRKLEAVLSADVNELYMRIGIEFVALGKEYSYSWSVEKKVMGSTEQGRAALSHAMINKMEPDVSDLENGVVSGARLMNKYANVKAYFEQPAKISDAAAVLERNAEMTRFVQKRYVEEFGEELPDFDEMNARLIENIGVIKANIDVAERSAALFEMKDTVDKLREISESSNGSDREIAAEAVEKYDKSVELSSEMRELLERLDETRDAICSISDERRRNAQNAVKSRGIYGEQYRGSMYEYAKSVREKMESTYKDLPKNGYINLWNDEQIREIVLRAEEYFRTNG